MNALSARSAGPIGWAARQTKSALRSYGVRTADDRPPPDFVIIGSKRGGTTSLWEYLSEHPGLLPLFPAKRAKGTYFLTDHWAEGPDWWRSHFPTEARRERAATQLGYAPVAGEATPYYLYHPLAPTRLAELAPDTLAIAVLRNPIDRTFSHYKERRRHTETLEFEAAMAVEDERLAGEEDRILADPSYVSFAHRHQSYVGQSLYGPMLARWESAVGRERLLVVTAEEFYADPQRLVDTVCERLGLPTITLADPSPRNAEPSSGMDPAVRERLRERFAVTIGEVDAYLGRPTGWA